MFSKLPIVNSVREYRKAQGLTQTDLAERVGVTRQTIAAIEQRKYSPSLEVAFKLANELDVAIGQLFQWQES